MRRFSIIILLILTTSLFLTGCFQAPAQGKPGGDAPAIISVWYTLDGKNEEVLLKQFERINREKPEVLIKGRKVPESRFVDTVWNVQAGGEGPEIIIAGRPTIFALYEKGTISPVQAESQIYAAGKAVFTFNQQPFAVAWLTDVPLLYYRKDRIPEPPASMSEILEKKNAVAVRSWDTTLLSPWWKAEGGSLAVSGLPALDAQANIAFLSKLLYLRAEGLLLFDDQAVNRFKTGNVNYLLGWSSDKLLLDQAGVAWGCISLHSLLGANGKALLNHTVGIANSSIKTVPALENAIRLVEEELLGTEAETLMHKAGGYVPVNPAYYDGSAPESFNDQIAKTLENAWVLEGYTLDWKLLGIQDRAWDSIFRGAKIEAELAKEQLPALEKLQK